MTSGMSWYLEEGIERSEMSVCTTFHSFVIEAKVGKSILFKAHFKEKDSLVIFPETGSKKASFKQQRVGGPTSYLIPTTFTDSWS